jgi:curved DNA-binding protein CbpA
MRIADYIRHLSQRWVEAMSMPAAKKALGFHPKSEPTEREILKAYKKLALKYHPDRGINAPDKIRAINVAKDTLFGRLKADPPSMEDYKPDPGVQYKEVKPPKKPEPPEPEIVTWQEAAKKVPAAEWKFRTDMTFHGAGGKMDYVVYGTLGNAHIFVKITHEKDAGVPRAWQKAWDKYLEEWEAFKETAPEKAEELGDPEEKAERIKTKDVWEMVVTSVPLKKGDPSKIIYQMLKKLKAKMSAALMPENVKISDEKTINTFWQFNFRSMKQILPLIKLAPATQAKRLIVLMDMGRNMRGEPHVEVSVNRNEVQLQPESALALEKKGWLKVLWPKRKEFGRDPAVNVTKHPKGKQILHWMAQHLTKEPERLRWMWKAAGDQAKG